MCEPSTRLKYTLSVDCSAVVPSEAAHVSSSRSLKVAVASQLWALVSQL